MHTRRSIQCSRSSCDMTALASVMAVCSGPVVSQVTGGPERCPEPERLGASGGSCSRVSSQCRYHFGTTGGGTQSKAPRRGYRRSQSKIQQKGLVRSFKRFEGLLISRKKVWTSQLGDDGSGMMAQPASSYGWPADSAVVTGGAVTPLSPGPVFEVTPPPPSHPAHIQWVPSFWRLNRGLDLATQI